MKIFVKARAGAKEKKVEKTDETHFIVTVKEPPKEDRANRAIAKALAEHFGVAPSCVHLVSGFSSKSKVFKLP